MIVISQVCLRTTDCRVIDFGQVPEPSATTPFSTTTYIFARIYLCVGVLVTSSHAMAATGALRQCALACSDAMRAVRAFASISLSRYIQIISMATIDTAPVPVGYVFRVNPLCTSPIATLRANV